MKECGCKIEHSRKWSKKTSFMEDTQAIIYCPLHAAAQRMLNALKNINGCQNHHALCEPCRLTIKDEIIYASGKDAR